MFGENEEYIKEEFRKGNVILLTGAGFSLTVKNLNGKSFPTGYELGQRILNFLGEQDDSADIFQAFQKIKNEKNEEQINSFLTQELTVLNESIPVFYNALVLPKWNRIYTFNFDNLVEEVYKANELKIEVLSTFRNERKDRAYSESLQYIKLNGNLPYELLNGTPSLIMTRSDYGSASSQSMPFYDQFSEDYATHTLIYIGTKMDEWLFDQAISIVKKRRITDLSQRPLSFIILPKDSLNSTAISNYRSTNKFEYIAADTEIFLKWLSTNKEAIIFQPPVFQKPVRSERISMKDVVGIGKREEINKNYFFTRILDSLLLQNIKEGKNLIVTGQPLSGKTRAVVEALKWVTNKSILLPDIALKQVERIIIPKHYNSDYIFLLDDLDELFQTYGTDRINTLIKESFNNKIQVIVTYKLGMGAVLASVMKDEILENFDMISIAKMDEKENNRYKEFCKKNNLPIDESNYDGTLGSYHLPLIAKRKLFENLDTSFKKAHPGIDSTLAKKILKAVKVFYLTGKYITALGCRINELFDYCNETYFTNQLIPSHWLSAIDFLTNNNQLLQHNNNYLSTEEIYFKEVFSFSVNYELSLLYKKPRKQLFQQGFNLNVFSITKSIKESKSLEEGRSILSKLEALHIRPNVVTYSTLLNLCKDYEEGNKVLAEMWEQSKTNAAIRPNVVTYSTLLNLCKDYEEGNKVLAEMWEQSKTNAAIRPNVVTYSTLLNLCKDYEEGKKVLAEMWEQSKTNAAIRPNVVTYSTLLNLCKDYEEGKKVLAEMWEQSKTNAAIRPNVVTYNTLLNLCKDYEEGKKVLAEMWEQSKTNAAIRPNVVTYNTLLNLCKDYEEGKKVLAEMWEQSKTNAAIRPDVVTYSTLLNLCKDYEEGNKVLAEMWEQSKTNAAIRPNVVTYNTLLNLCKDYEEGKKVLAEMWEQSKTNAAIRPNVVTYNTLLNLCKDYEEGKKVLAEMWEQSKTNAAIRPNVVTYNTLLNLCKDYEEGKKVLAEMWEQSKTNAAIRPDVVTYSTLLNLCKDYEEGNKVLAEMWEQSKTNAAIRPNVVTYSTLLNLCKDYEECKKYLLDLNNYSEVSVSKQTFQKKVSDFQLNEYDQNKFLLWLAINKTDFFKLTLKHIKADVLIKFGLKNKELINKTNSDYLSFIVQQALNQEYIGDDILALIDDFKNENSYQYHRIMGLYWFNKKNMLDAKHSFKKAIELLPDGNFKDRAYITFNLAKASFEEFKNDKDIKLLSESEGYCIEAVSFHIAGFNAPKEMMALIKFLQSDILEQPNLILRLSKMGIGKGTIRKIITELDLYDHDKAENLKSLLSKSKKT